MPGPLILRIIGDARSGIRAVEQQVAANAKLSSSITSVATTSKLSADAQVAAAVKSSEALRVNAIQVTAAASKLPAGAGRDAGLVAAAAAQAKYNRSIGITTTESARLGAASKTAERDLGKMTRGALAGSGAVVGLGRSLAFASGGFLALAGGATLIRSSIAAAEALKRAQDSLAVAIEHTGGNLAKLKPEYTATAKAAAQFGVSQVDATTGLARATVLTGNAAAAQRAYQEALVISKATGKDFNTVLVATSKGQAGITTSLRRYGILVKTGSSGTAQFTQVMQRFGGQAAANTTASDRLRATFANTQAVIGQQLLPTFEHLSASLSKWLTKMNRTGQLQKDVNAAIHVGADVFKGLGFALKVVDKVTGSFANTLKLLIGLKFASLVTGWIGELELLAAKWGLVAGAAGGAAKAEAGALALPAVPIVPVGAAATAETTAARAARSGVVLPAGVGAEVAGGAGLGAAISKLFTRGGAGSVVARIKQFGGAADTSGAAAAGATLKFARLARGLGELALIAASPQLIGGAHKVEDKGRNFLTGHLGRTGAALSDIFLPTSIKDFTGKSFIQDVFGGGSRNKPIPVFFSLQFLKFGQRFGPPAPFTPQGFGLGPKPGVAQSGPFGGAKPIPVFKTFQLSGSEQITQARAALTRSNADDVAAAKAVIARIKRLIDQGHLAGKSLIQALQAEGSALSTLWSAEDAAAQKRAQRAAAAKARIQAQLQDSIDPLKLEVGLSRAQAFGQPILPHLKALLAAAQKALSKGLSLALQKQALDQIASLKQQIKDAATTPVTTFTAPAKLQLALAKDEALGRSPVNDLLKLKAAILRFIQTHKHNTAALIDAYQQLGAITQQLASSFTMPPKLQFELARDQALGRDTTKDLLKMRAAILKFIRTHKHNFAALTDAYQQLSAINDQLGSTASSALGLFKQASTKALTAGLGLTAAQRKALRARLSQRGPGGTVPGSGVGAAGFAIDPKTGRPFAAKPAKSPSVRTPRPRQAQAAAVQPIDIRENFNFTVKLNEDVLGRHQIRYQQRHRRRNPSQRRGPNAGG